MHSTALGSGSAAEKAIGPAFPAVADDTGSQAYPPSRLACLRPTSVGPGQQPANAIHTRVTAGLSFIYQKTQSSEGDSLDK